MYIKLTRQLDWSMVPEHRGKVHLFFIIGATEDLQVKIRFQFQNNLKL